MRLVFSFQCFKDTTTEDDVLYNVFDPGYEVETGTKAAAREGGQWWPWMVMGGLCSSLLLSLEIPPREGVIACIPLWLGFGILWCSFS